MPKAKQPARDGAGTQTQGFPTGLGTVELSRAYGRSSCLCTPGTPPWPCLGGAVTGTHRAKPQCQASGMGKQLCERQGFFGRKGGVGEKPPNTNCIFKNPTAAQRPARQPGVTSVGRQRPRKAGRDTAILKGLFLEAEVRTWGRERIRSSTGTGSARLDWPTGWGQGGERTRSHLLGASVGAATARWKTPDLVSPP